MFSSRAVKRISEVFRIIENTCDLRNEHRLNKIPDICLHMEFLFLFSFYCEISTVAPARIQNFLFEALLSIWMGK